MQFVDHDELLRRLGDGLTDDEEAPPPVVLEPPGPIDHVWSVGPHEEATVLVAKTAEGTASQFHTVPSDGTFFQYRCTSCNLACVDPDQLPAWAAECNDVFDLVLVEEIMDL